MTMTYLYTDGSPVNQGDTIVGVDHVVDRFCVTSEQKGSRVRAALQTRYEVVDISAGFLSGWWDVTIRSLGGVGDASVSGVIRKATGVQTSATHNGRTLYVTS